MLRKPIPGVVLRFLLIVLAVFPAAAERQLLSADTPDTEIIYMNPENIDPSLLPLDSIEDLHVTGSVQDVDLASWRLRVQGSGLGREFELSYRELRSLPSVKKKVILICPGFFVDYVEWEGVAVKTILEKAGAKEDFKTVVFKSIDGYTGRFSREDIENHLLFLAYRVNGERLPKEHGFPLRLVAEGVLGGRWVKWLDRIEVN